jgi:hypothetical protein
MNSSGIEFATFQREPRESLLEHEYYEIMHCELQRRRHVVVYLVEALCYNPEGSISPSVIVYVLTSAITLDPLTRFTF